LLPISDFIPARKLNLMMSIEAIPAPGTAAASAHAPGNAAAFRHSEKLYQTLIETPPRQVFLKSRSTLRTDDD